MKIFFLDKNRNAIVIGLHEILGILALIFSTFRLTRILSDFVKVSLEAVELQSDKVRPESSSLWRFRLPDPHKIDWLPFGYRMPVLRPA